VYSKSRIVILSLAVIGLGLDVGGRSADDGGTHGPDGSLTTSLMAGLAETVGSTVAYAQARRNCEAARLGTRSRRCVRRTAWNFLDTSDTNYDPQLTPDGRFVVFGSREILDGNRGDIPPAEDEAEGGQGVATIDIFLQDLVRASRPVRVSVDERGNIVRVASDPLNPPQPSASFSPAISADGRLVAFATDGAFLPGQDLNGEIDVYRKDVVTGDLILVSAAEGSPPGLAVGGVPEPPGFSGRRVVAMSDNGRFVAFLTTAPLDNDRDFNNELDVYVKDLDANEYFLASILVDMQGNISAGGAAVSGIDVSAENIDISANGRFVAFASPAALNPADNDQTASGFDGVDVYIWDRLHPDAAPVLASGSADPRLPSVGRSFNPTLSANGRFVAFESEAALVTNDTNGVSDIYRYDRVTDRADRKVVRVSVDARGRETVLEGSRDPTISANGRFVAFSSAAGDLVLNDTSFAETDRTPAGDALGAEDIFVKDLRTAAITRASVDEDGVETDGTSFSPSLSADGTLITFLTDDARILVPVPGTFEPTPGDAVVVTAVDFAPLPASDIPGAPPGAPRIEIVPTPSSAGFALRNTIDRQGDQDWFRVSLVAGNTYLIDLEGRPSRQGTLDDPLLRILVPKIPGEDLDLEALDDDGGQGLNARLRYEARATGVHFISAEGFGNATGTYRLLVREQ
jgi:TolB protein